MNPEEHNPIVLDKVAIAHLRIARKWSNFLSIAGFIFLVIMGLIIIGAVAVFGFAGGLVGSTVLLQVLPLTILAIVYAFPIYYLFQFGKQSKIAVRDSDSDAITLAFHYLKLHYRFMGILLIVVVAMYIVGIVAALSFLHFSPDIFHI